MLRSAAGALLSQGALHSELVQLEWAEEKYRLLRMLLTIVAGSLFLCCCLLSLSAMVLVSSWGTPWQSPVSIGLTLFYGTGTLVAWFKLTALFALGNQAFAGTRAELAADFALLRSTLDSPR